MHGLCSALESNYNTQRRWDRVSKRLLHLLNSLPSKNLLGRVVCSTYFYACLDVACLALVAMRPAETSEPIAMQFGGQICVCPMNQVQGGPKTLHIFSTPYFGIVQDKMKWISPGCP